MAFAKQDRSEFEIEGGSIDPQPLSLHGTPSRFPSPDDLARYDAFVTRATDVIGDSRRASLWFSTPNSDFAGEAPLRIAQLDGYSLERFEPIFIRIEHGIDF